MENKERQRYILFRVIADEQIDQDKLIQVIWRNIFQLFGETGTSQTGLWLVEYDLQKGYGILRTNVESLHIVRSTLAVIKNVDGKNCILASLGVSGTINSLKEKHLSKINSTAQ